MNVSASAASSSGGGGSYSASLEWIAVDKDFVATNEVATHINVVGWGFEKHYNPVAPPFFVYLRRQGHRMWSHGAR